MSAKLKLALWYLKQPKLYPELFRRVRRKVQTLGVNHAEIKQQVAQWCEAQAVDTRDAILQLTGWTTFAPVAELFAEPLRAAQKRVERYTVISGPGNLDLIYHLTEFLQAERVVETGVAYGWSSLAFLLSLRRRPAARLISTDLPYAFNQDQSYVGCVVPPALRAQWQLLCGADREVLPSALAQLRPIDLCHYDSDKSYEGRLWAYQQLWAALRPGGIFISDDVDDNWGFRDFCHCVAQPPLIVRSPATRGVKYVGVLVKPASQMTQPGGR
ncbi:MAG: class I SAM-dependent methyltransferase [Acidobacteriota bacterium]|nr:class I SAM-dependent methyltransferase [Blastocatellia bacterium]MDW8238666.1 class I SAM-dependent methyltransferase [Acidobacteriota bacterium]